MKTYFHRVAEQTPTMFWINNPTRRQADMAIAEGALGCTNNPSYTQKMIDHPEESAYALKLLDEAIRETETDSQAAIIFQQKMVKPIAEKFMPMFEKSQGEHGYVSIQGDPINDEDAEVIYKESLENRTVGKNICCKIPVTPPGIAAMQELVPLDVPLNSTEIFAINQMVTICETYEKISMKSGKKPKFYMSHIAGIYDDYLQNRTAVRFAYKGEIIPNVEMKFAHDACLGEKSAMGFGCVEVRETLSKTSSSNTLRAGNDVESTKGAKDKAD